MTPEDYAWQSDYTSPLGDVYCITFVRGLDEREVLSRLGARPESIVPITLDEVMDRVRANQLDTVVAAKLDGWTAMLHIYGAAGNSSEDLAALSRVGEAVSILRHDYATDNFGYAVNGQLITSFEPLSPHLREGSDADHLIQRMREVGLNPDGGLSPEPSSDPVPAALALASKITGVLFTPDLLGQPLLGAKIATSSQA